MKDALEFLLQIRGNSMFRSRAQVCTTEEERLAFLRDEAFEFAPEDLATIMRAWPVHKDSGPEREDRERRKVERHDTFMKVTEINGRPVEDAVMLDISAWGAKIESLIPLGADTNVEFNFSLPGEGREEKVKLSGKVVWSGQVPANKRYKLGMQFYKSIEQRQGDAGFDIKKFQKVAQKRDLRISRNSFLTVKEFADTIGVHWFTVWRWTAEHRIEFKQLKAGCKILIPMTELLKFQKKRL